MPVIDANQRNPQAPPDATSACDLDDRGREPWRAVWLVDPISQFGLRPAHLEVQRASDKTAPLLRERDAESLIHGSGASSALKLRLRVRRGPRRPTPPDPTPFCPALQEPAACHPRLRLGTWRAGLSLKPVKTRVMYRTARRKSSKASACDIGTSRSFLAHYASQHRDRRPRQLDRSSTHASRAYRPRSRLAH